jgi:hypothetical protein
LCESWVAWTGVRQAISEARQAASQVAPQRTGQAPLPEFNVTIPEIGDLTFPTNFTLPANFSLPADFALPTNLTLPNFNGTIPGLNGTFELPAEAAPRVALPPALAAEIGTVEKDAGGLAPRLNWLLFVPPNTSMLL